MSARKNFENEVF